MRTSTSSDQPRLLRLGIRQMLALVGFGAIGALVLTPMVRLLQLEVVDWPEVVLVGIVTVSSSWALSALLLIRRGPFRDWFVMVLLSLTLCTILVIAVVLIAFAHPREASGIVFAGGLARLIVALLTFAMILGGLILACLFVLSRVIPKRCPRCRWWLLVRDVRSDVRAEAGPFVRQIPVRQCLGCGQRCWMPRAAWAPLPEGLLLPEGLAVVPLAKILLMPETASPGSPTVP